MSLSPDHSRIGVNLRIDKKSLHRHRAMSIVAGPEKWEICVWSRSSTASPKLDNRRRESRVEVREREGLRLACSLAEKYGVPRELVFFSEVGGGTPD